MRLCLVCVSAVIALAFSTVGCCPLFPPPSNGNGNGNANINQNTSNGNQNSANQNGNANENANENQNQNLNGNENQNSTNQNENGSVNANDNANANGNANENTNENSNENTNGNANENTNQNSNENTNVNGNANENTNGNANENENSNSSGLTAQEQTAVTDVTFGMAGLGSVLNAFFAVGTTTVDFDNLSPPTGDYNGPMDEGGGGNDCPVGVYQDDGGNITIFNTDYGAGCFNDRTNDEIVSGQIDMVYDRSNHTGVISFSNLVVNGNAISGVMNLALTNGGLEGFVTFSGTVDLVIGGVVAVNGPINGIFTFNMGLYQTQISGTDVSFTTNTITRTVDLAGIVIDPLAEPNFAPRSGTATIDEAGLDSLLVQYSTDSPDNGIVTVTAGADPPVEFDIPGLGS